MEAACLYKTPYFYHTIRHHISGHSHCHKNLKSNNFVCVCVCVRLCLQFLFWLYCVFLVNWDLESTLGMRLTWGGYTPGAGMWIGNICARAFITYITVTVRAPDLAANMFGIGTHVFHYHLIAVIQLPASYPTPSFFFCLSTLCQHTNRKLSRNRR